VEAVLSHEIKQYRIDGENVILNREEQDQKVSEFTFEENQIYAIDILMSTGKGKTKEGFDSRTTVFKRAVDRNYQLKVQASRDLLSEINKKFSHGLPFSLRSLDPKKRRMGIKEITSHDLVDPYPVLFERDGEFIAQFKFTAYISQNGPVKLTAGFPLPHVTSQYDINGVAEIQEVLAIPLQKQIPETTADMEVAS